MLEWNHNTIYHNRIIRHLSDSKIKALDIGSGLGLFSKKLSSIYNEVDSLEPDAISIDYAKKNHNKNNIKHINNTFVEHDFNDDKYDFVSMIASIHHLDFEIALKKVISLLKPGGKLYILGLYKESSIIDLTVSLIAIIPNFIMRVISNDKKHTNDKMITTSPNMSIKEIKKESKKVLGNITFRRHLFWRYSLIYEK